MDFKGIGWKGVDLTYLAQDGDKARALVKAVMNICFCIVKDYLENMEQY
jgi:hypothetical protein